MRIGIVTPFDSRNFGNRLQNYALQQTLRNYAENVITIKNKPANPDWKDRLRRKSPQAESVWCNRLLGETRKAWILEFNRRHIAVTKNLYWHNRDYPSLKPEDRCQWYCAGSDQIWNPELGRAGMFNYLGFGPGDATFAYAASFGVEKIPVHQEETVRKGLQHIKYLSVREEAGKRIVQELTGRTDVEILPDPTLLLTPEKWDAVIQKPSGPLPERYLLTYFLGSVSQVRREAVLAQARKMNCPIISLMEPDSPFYAIGPGEFLYLVKHAALVCTDSFHGSVFSFLYERPLVIFNREGKEQNMGSRLDTLTRTYHLEDCRAVGNRMPPIFAVPDYSMGQAVLREERAKAKAFLDNIFCQK